MVIKLDGTGKTAVFGERHQFTQQTDQIQIKDFRMQGMQTRPVREMHLPAVEHLQHHKLGDVSDPALLRRANTLRQIGGAGGDQPLYVTDKAVQNRADAQRLAGRDEIVIQHQRAAGLKTADTAQREHHHRTEIFRATDNFRPQLPQRQRLHIAVRAVYVADLGARHAVALRTLPGAANALHFADVMGGDRQGQVNIVTFRCGEFPWLIWLRQQILLRNAEHGAVRQTARRPVDHHLALCQQFSVQRQLGESPGKITQRIQPLAQHRIVMALLLLKVLGQRKHPFLPEHPVFHCGHRYLSSVFISILFWRTCTSRRY